MMASGEKAILAFSRQEAVSSFEFRVSNPSSSFKFQVPRAKADPSAALRDDTSICAKYLVA
jgi:hypothetical protein